MDQDSWDVIIVGGGPAGLSAALLLGRSRRRVLVIDAGSPRNRFAAHVHGILGNEDIRPADLVARGRAEAAEYGVEFASGTIERVERTADILRVTDVDGTERTARAMIVATGIRDDLPAIPGLAERWGSTVLHCPYCHGWEVRDQHLGVLAFPPGGLHQAELIRQWSDRVTVFTAGMTPIAPEVEQRLRSRGVVLEAAPVTAIVGNGTAIEAVRLDDGRDVAIDAVFTAGAPRPHDGFLAPLGLDRTEGPFGSFLTVDFAGRASDDRIWAVGNVVNPTANVPMSIGAGALTGGAVNGALVGWDFDRAMQVEVAATGS
ncbi:NAD(P)/FAD-dependent oxidoreductase [Humibacter soli]